MTLLEPSDLWVPPALDPEREAIWRQAFAATDDPAELTELLEELKAELHRGWRDSPSAMGAYLTGGAVRRWRYVELLARKFVDLVEGRSKRQIWEIPSRMGKSWMGARWGPVWALDRDPSLKLAIVSAGDTLANEHSSWILDTLRVHEAELNVTLHRDRQRQDRFVTDAGGGLISAGIGSLLIGFGADGVVEDDPFRNWQEAHSPTRRKVVYNHFRSVVRLRLETEASWILVIQTRWHEEDLAGLLEASDAEGDGEGWEVIRLPAIAEAPSTNLSDPPSWRQPDPLGRQPGEIIEPERFSRDEVEARARTLGSYLAAGLEQQRPAPEEGGEIKRHWWRWHDSPPPRFDELLTSWDMKMKDKAGGPSSSYAVGQCWGRVGPDFWLVDQLRGRWNLVESKTAVVLMAVRHPDARRHLIENKALGPDVIDALKRPQPGYTVSDEVRGELGITDDELPAVEALFRRGLAGLVPEEPKGDKVVRARAQTPLIEAGNVHLLEGRSWADALVNEAAAFPGGTTDMVDTMSQALKRLSKPRGRAGSGIPTGPIVRAR